MLRSPISARMKKQLRIGHDLVVKYLWEIYNNLFKTDADCWEGVFAGHVVGACRHCATVNSEVDFDRRMIDCTGCGVKIWLSATTIFHGVRNIRAWFGAVWLMEHGIILTSSGFAKLAGIAQSTALHILRTLRMVLHYHFEDDSPETASAVLSEVVCKRSLETPARFHPHEEEAAIQREREEREKKEREEREKKERERKEREQKEKEQKEKEARAKKEEDLEQRPCDSEKQDAEGKQDVNRDDDALESSAHGAIKSDKSNLVQGLDGLAKEIYDTLSDDPVSFDALCRHFDAPVGDVSAALTSLDLDGLVVRLPGDAYIRASELKAPKIPCVANVERNITFGADDIVAQAGKGSLVGETRPVSLTAVVDFVLLSYHGISRKYMQLYVAAHWCHRVRYRWGWGGLREACLRFGPIKLNHILSYVTPPVVKLFEHEN